MKQSFFLIIISIFLLSGCSSAVDQTPTKAITPGPTRYATKEITILPSMTPDSHGLKVIQSSPVFQETLIIPPTYGILLTDELNADQEDRYYGIDSIKILLLEDNSEKTIFIDNVSSVELLSVSPDYKHIAFEKSTDRPLADYVIDTRGNIVYSRTWPEEEFPYLVGWLDDESIILGISSPSLTPFTTKIVDIFNNDEIVLDPSILPDITHGGYYGYRFWHNYSFVEAVYSPDLKHVVYPLNANSDGQNNIVLWDVVNSKKISQIDFKSYSDGEPVWARDSSHFVTERDGLITVSITGEVTTLFSFELIPEYEYVSQYRWSPDETKIAMWLWNTEQKNNALAIFDSSFNSLTIYDIYQGGYDSMPYWSPDGRFLLINGDFMDDAQSKSGVLILDLVTNTFFRISEKSTAAGWVIIK